LIGQFPAGGAFDDPAFGFGVVLGFLLMGLAMGLVLIVLHLAALGLLRLIPWRGPTLDVDGGEPLRGVFD
jgi:hypothetical protein